MEANTTNTKMRYRYLGNSGIQVSVLSWGNWINVKNENDVTTETVKLALESGINFFDTAEIYGFGVAETSLGEAFKKLNVKRESVVVSTKIFKVGHGVNDALLSRKHIVEGLNNSLKRLQLDYVDIVFCHRFDDITPLEEVCRAMNHVINQGKAFYWATSEWASSQIMEAFAICEKYNLIKPICDQCQYNLLERNKVENDYTHLFDKHNYGTTVWSPLFSGVLTGKYRKDDLKEGRLNTKDESSMHKFKYFAKKAEIDSKLDKLEEIAKRFNCSLAQLALAWVIKSSNVSTCILGTSKVEQLKENLVSLDIVEKLTEDVEKEIEDIMDTTPSNVRINWRTFELKESRRLELSRKSDWKAISKNVK